MNSSERIVKYLENDLTPEELFKFENELRHSSELKKELDNYLRVKQTTINLKSIRLNQQYLDSIIFDFRNRLDVPITMNTKSNLKYALVTLFILIASTFIWKNYFSDRTQLSDLGKFTQSLSEDQKIELLEKLNMQYEDSELINEYLSTIEVSDLLLSEVKINDEIAEAYNFTYNELVPDLDMDEVNRIYNEILNRDF
jgi:hypothetical protein